MPEPTLRRTKVHVLYPGTFHGTTGVVTFRAEDVRALAESYDPAIYTAPVVLGHPAHDDPAWGEVVATELEGDDLWLWIDVVDELVQLVEEKRYSKLSIAAWPPGAPSSPRPETWYLKHLGFLGAAAPAVKGLKPIKFSNADGVVVEIDGQSSSTEVMMSEMKSAARKNEPERVDEQRPPPEWTVAFAEREAKLDEREARVAEREARAAQREAKLDERERAIARREYELRLQEHVRAARILPEHVPMLAALMERLESATIELADGPATGAAALEGFLAQLPARVPVGPELAGASGERRAAKRPLPNVPDGYEVAPDRLALWERAWELAEARSLDFAAAVDLAAREMGRN